MIDPRFQVLEILTHKGWALYPTEKKEGVVADDSDIESIVKKGRIKNYFDLDDRRSLILPLAEEDDNFAHVSTLVDIQKNPPCHHDFFNTGVPPWKLNPKEMADSLLGVYPIDSVAYNGNLILVFDRRHPMNSELYKDALEFGFPYMANVLKCINKFNVVEGKTVVMPNYITS